MRRALILAALLTAAAPGTAFAGRWLPAEQLPGGPGAPPQARAGEHSVFLTWGQGQPLALHRGDPDLPPADAGVAIPGAEGAWDATVAVDRDGHVVVAWVTVRQGDGYHSAWTDGRAFASVWTLGAAPPRAPQRLDHEPLLALMEPRAAMAGGTAAVAWTRYSDFAGTETQSRGVGIAAGRATGALRSRSLTRRPGGLVSLTAVRGRPEAAWTVRRRRDATLLRRRFARRGAWRGPPRVEASFDAGSLVTYQVSPRGDRLLAHRVFEPGVTSDVLARLAPPGRPFGPPRRFKRCFLAWKGAVGADGTVAVAYPGGRVAARERRLRVVRGTTAGGWRGAATLGRVDESSEVAVVADGDGRTWVGWSSGSRRRLQRINAVSAALGRPFGRPAVLAGRAGVLYYLELGVDGRGDATARWFTDERGFERARYR